MLASAAKYTNQKQTKKDSNQRKATKIRTDSKQLNFSGFLLLASKIATISKYFQV